MGLVMIISNSPSVSPSHMVHSIGSIYLEKIPTHPTLGPSLGTSGSRGQRVRPSLFWSNFRGLAPVSPGPRCIRRESAIQRCSRGAYTTQAVPDMAGSAYATTWGGDYGTRNNHIRQRGAYTTPEPALLPPLHRREEVSHGAYAMTKLT